MTITNTFVRRLPTALSITSASPWTRRELNRALLTAVGELNREREAQRREESMTAQIEQNRAYLLEHFSPRLHRTVSGPRKKSARRWTCSTSVRSPPVICASRSDAIPLPICPRWTSIALFCPCVSCFQMNIQAMTFFFAQNDADLLCGVISFRAPFEGGGAGQRSRGTVGTHPAIPHRFQPHFSHYGAFRRTQQRGRSPRSFPRSRHYAARPFLPVCVAGTLLYWKFFQPHLHAAFSARHRKEKSSRVSLPPIIPLASANTGLFFDLPFFLRQFQRHTWHLRLRGLDPAPGVNSFTSPAFRENGFSACWTMSGRNPRPRAYVRYQAEP